MSANIDKIYKNEALKSWISSLAAQKSLGHAYVIDGPRGSGKYTMALYAAAALACERSTPPCFECRSCKKIAEGASPDVITYRVPDNKKTIGVDLVRAIKQQAYIVPSELDIKVFIICDADLMTVQAQNALLKLLEEPPKKVYFFLLTTKANTLIPTIRSRAPVRSMQVFSDSEISEYLLSTSEKAKRLNSRSPEDFAEIIHYSSGRIGAALKTLSVQDADKFKRTRSSIDRMLELMAGLSYSELLIEIRSLPQKREDSIEFLQNLHCAIRDIAAAKSAPASPLIFYGSRKDVDAFAEKLPLATLIRWEQLILSAIDALNSNLNVSSVLLSFAEQLWKYK